MKSLRFTVVWKTVRTVASFAAALPLVNSNAEQRARYHHAQDSGEHFSYVRDEQRRPFFQALAQTCRESVARLWGNVEVAEMECPSPEEYVRRYGRVHHSMAKGIQWRAVPMDRLRSKLSLAAEYSDRIVSWGYQQFGRPVLGGQGGRMV